MPAQGRPDRIILEEWLLIIFVRLIQPLHN